MTVENHPKYEEWKERLDQLIEVKQAIKEGRATEIDLKKALKSYNKIADEI